ncbi:hypothetical protein EDC01DRAFT_655519 [Geopyxis carbonaria]|nr:hypothetical protein EDC01DRAFT_655519 [Geopyxis carbonaria]
MSIKVHKELLALQTTIAIKQRHLHVSVNKQTTPATTLAQPFAFSVETPLSQFVSVGQQISLFVDHPNGGIQILNKLNRLVGWVEPEFDSRVLRMISLAKENKRDVGGTITDIDKDWARSFRLPAEGKMLLWCTEPKKEAPEPVLEETEHEGEEKKEIWIPVTNAPFNRDDEEAKRALDEGYDS